MKERSLVALPRALRSPRCLRLALVHFFPPSLQVELGMDLFMNLFSHGLDGALGRASLPVPVPLDVPLSPLPRLFPP